MLYLRYTLLQNVTPHAIKLRIATKPCNPLCLASPGDAPKGIRLLIHARASLPQVRRAALIPILNHLHHTNDGYQS